MKHADYYEFLQISPNAEPETIHRVYRFLGARYHPDNPQTADPEKFSVLRTAYEILSDSDRRAEYDSHLRKDTAKHAPISESIDFMDAIEGETNRRLAVMAVLCFRRRSHPANPDVALAELEARMGFPRDFLDFTTWYLKKKGLISIGDNATFSLTVQGVDFVESERLHIPVLHKLLTNGSNGSKGANGVNHSSNGVHANGASNNGSSAHVELPKETSPGDRRLGAENRRVRSEDRRKTIDLHPLIERRVATSDRRSGARERRNK